jgi:hypothetical protein
MKVNGRAWSTIVVAAATGLVALLQPTVAAASQDRSVEPADDYTANSLLAFALGGAGLG